VGRICLLNYQYIRDGSVVGSGRNARDDNAAVTALTSADAPQAPNSELRLRYYLLFVTLNKSWRIAFRYLPARRALLADESQRPNPVRNDRLEELLDGDEPWDALAGPISLDHWAGGMAAPAV
jgi:hypothetical protein